MITHTQRKLFWALLMSAGFMVFLLMKVDWEHFPQVVSRIDAVKLIISLSVFIFSNFFRSLRFHRLDHMKNTLTHWWIVNSLYNLLTATLPGGSGEAASAYIIRKFSKLHLLSALRLLFLSRVMDLFALSFIFFTVSLLMIKETPYRQAAVFASGILFFLSSMALLRSTELFFLRIAQKLPDKFKYKKILCEKIKDLLDISDRQRAGSSLRVSLLQSLVMMLTGVLSVYLLFHSLGINFTPAQSAYCYGIYMIFQVVPIQGFAGIGTQAAWWALALNSAGYHAADTIALGFVLHGVFYVFIAVTGLFALLTWYCFKRV